MMTKPLLSERSQAMLRFAALVDLRQAEKVTYTPERGYAVGQMQKESLMNLYERYIPRNCGRRPPGSQPCGTHNDFRKSRVGSSSRC